MVDVQQLIGKTIAAIDMPKRVIVDGEVRTKFNMIVKFTDDTTLLLSSWTYEGQGNIGSGVEVRIR